MLLCDRFAPADRTAAARQRPAGLLLLSYLGVLLHVFMDFLNSYGVRLLMPFSERWFYGDALYIVDPWLYRLVGASWLARRPARRRGASRAAARVACALAAIYMLAMLASNLWARREVRGRPGARGPAAGDALHGDAGVRQPVPREVIVDVGDRYEKGSSGSSRCRTSVRPATASTKGSRSEPPPWRRPSPARAGVSRWSRFPVLRRGRSARSAACCSTTIATPSRRRPRMVGCGQVRWLVGRRG